MNLAKIEVGLTAEDCYLLREAIRRERVRVRAFGGRRWLGRIDGIAAEVEAVAATYESGASSMSATRGHPREQYLPVSRSGRTSERTSATETLAMQEESHAAGQVSAAQAAELLGMTARHVRRLAAAKQLQTARKHGRGWKVDLVEVVALMKESANG